MALYEIQEGALVEKRPTDFAALGLRERQDLQAYLFRNIAVLSDDLKVVAQEYGSWEDARRRLDILAVDREGHLVVIELKRTNDGGHAELQALRYAAMVSSLTFDDLVEAYAATLNTMSGADLAGPDVDPREDLAAFLEASAEDEPEISEDVRIILVAADFGRELTTAVLWLNRFDRMDIRCVRLRPYNLDGRTILDVEQVLPLPEAADYQVRMRRKEAAARNERESSRDRTRYVVVASGQESEPLPKRWAVLRLLQAVRAAGVRMQQIKPAVVGPRLLPVDGELTGEALISAFTASYPSAANNLGRWFFDEPIHDAGQTWVLSNQWGGSNAARTMEALIDLAPASAGITCEPG